MCKSVYVSLDWKAKPSFCVSGGGRKMWHEMTPTLFTAMEVLPSAPHANHFLSFLEAQPFNSCHHGYLILHSMGRSLSPLSHDTFTKHLQAVSPAVCQGQLLSFVHVVGTFNIETVGTRERAQRLREDPGLVPNIHLVAHNHL